MIINFYINKQLSEMQDPNAKIRYLHDIIQFCNKKQQIITMKHDGEYVEVINKEEPVKEIVDEVTLGDD